MKLRTWKRLLGDDPAIAVGRGALLVGSVMILGSLGHVIGSRFIEVVSHDNGLGSSPILEHGYEQYSLVLIVAQGALGLAFALAGVFAVRRRPWARTAIEVELWALIILMALSFPAWIGIVRSIPGPVSSIMLAWGIVVLLVGIGVGVRLAIYLRSDLVRNSFREGA